MPLHLLDWLFTDLFAKAIEFALACLLSDALLGMLVAWKGGTFDYHRMGEYLAKDNAIRILVWVLLTELSALAAYAGFNLTEVGANFPTFVGAGAGVTVVGPLLGDIAVKILKLVGTLPIETVKPTAAAKSGAVLKDTGQRPGANVQRAARQQQFELPPIEPVEVEHVARG